MRLGSKGRWGDRHAKKWSEEDGKKGKTGQRGGHADRINIGRAGREERQRLEAGCRNRQDKRQNKSSML